MGYKPTPVTLMRFDHEVQTYPSLPYAYLPLGYKHTQVTLMRS